MLKINIDSSPVSLSIHNTGNPYHAIIIHTYDADGAAVSEYAEW